MQTSNPPSDTQIDPNPENIPQEKEEKPAPQDPQTESLEVKQEPAQIENENSINQEEESQNSQDSQKQQLSIAQQQQNIQELQKKLNKQQNNFVEFASSLPGNLRDEPIDLQNTYNDIKFKHTLFPDYKEILLIYQKDVSKMIASKQEKKNWNQDDIVILIWIIIKYTKYHNKNYKKLERKDWSFISTLIPGKDIQSIKFKFLSLIKSNIINDPWQEEENSLLKSLVEKYGKQRWQVISKELYEKSQFEIYRTSKQCREHFNNHLDPSISKQTWSKDEDIQLLKLIQEFGKKWALIARKLEGRTENAVKNRYHALERSLEKNYQYSQKYNKDASSSTPQPQPQENESNSQPQNQNLNQSQPQNQEYQSQIMQLIQQIQITHKTTKSESQSALEDPSLPQKEKKEESSFLNLSINGTGFKNFKKENSTEQQPQQQQQMDQQSMMMPKFPLQPQVQDMGGAMQQPILLPQLIPLQMPHQPQLQMPTPAQPTEEQSQQEEIKKMQIQVLQMSQLTPEKMQKDYQNYQSAIFNEQTKELYLYPNLQQQQQQGSKMGQQQQQQYQAMPYYQPQYVYMNQGYPTMMNQQQMYGGMQYGQNIQIIQPFQQSQFFQQQGDVQQQQDSQIPSSFPQQVTPVNQVKQESGKPEQQEINKSA